MSIFGAYEILGRAANYAGANEVKSGAFYG